MGLLVSINISKGGIPKNRVARVEVTATGLVGDGRDHAKHEKLTRAVSLLDCEILDELRGEGYGVDPGVLGENLTVKELRVQRLDAGTRLRFAGGAKIELTEARKPCFVLDAVDPRLKETSIGRIGWMARVITPGWLAEGETVVVEEGRKGEGP